LSRRGETLGVTVVYCLLTATLIVASFIDLELRIIPDSVTLGGALATPLFCVLFPELHQNPGAVEMGRRLAWFQSPPLGALAACGLGMAVGAGLTWATGVMGKAVFHKEAMGLGDVKLMAMIGGLMGWRQTLIIFFLAPVFGAVVGILMLLRTRDHHIPYGPFLSLATVVALLGGDRIIRMLGLA
jgi:leader peptidase (prepilin peptidase)/N-methyltransferase